eukprot:1314013-Prymnesium_polylepis.1
MTPAVEAAVWHVTLAGLSECESCCKLVEAAIGGNDARRMGVLAAAAELAACSLSCCICTPYQLIRV